jgi:hypothetical protein
VTKEEIDDLAHEIAEDAAKDALSSFCAREELDGKKWWNTASVATGFGEAYDVERAVRYLDANGILKRAPSNANYVGWDEDDE